MLQAQDNEAVKIFVLNETMQKINVMKLLQPIMQLITLQLTSDNLNLIALAMY